MSVTVGMQPPVVGQPFTVYVLVTNPAFVPVPAGSIDFDFGDGTPVVNVPLDYRIASTTHTYSAAGPAKVTVSYSGDSNFAATSATLQGQVVRSAPDVTLNVYGDSISYALNIVAPTGASWSIVAYVEGWKLNDLALPGYKVADEAPVAYGTHVATNTYSAVLLGQNDFNANSTTNPQYITEYQNSLLAVSMWLLIPDTDANGLHPKVSAQDPSVIKQGAWTQSSLYPVLGLQTTEAADSLTATVTGSTVYLGLSGTTASDYTLDVFVDGALAGEYSPSIIYPGNATPNIPWGIRIPLQQSGLTDSHTVTAVCKTPGTSGCSVDWFAGNGFAAPNKTPLLWLGEPYHTMQTNQTLQDLVPYIDAIRQIGQNLQADGLGITLADVFDNFNGQLESQCLVDAVHPAGCGHQIIAATFLGTMNWLFTKDQRIDFGSQNSANFSSTPIPVDVSTTSGLPVTLKLVSGPASLVNNAILPTAVGSVSLEANQGGDADFRPAATESKTIQILPAPVTVAVQPSSNHVVAPGAISVAVPVTWSGNTPVPGSVVLIADGTQIGTSQLDGTGVAAFANLQFPVGTHTLTATFAQQGNFAAGSSAPVNVVVVYPPADLQITPHADSASVLAGQDAKFTLNLMPSLGFTPTVTFTCTGLPALASCQFSQNPATLGAGVGAETVTIVTTGPHAVQTSSLSGYWLRRHAGNLPLALAGAFWGEGAMMWFAARYRKRRPRRGKKVIARLMLFALLALQAVLMTGCGSSAPATPAGTSTVTISAVAVQGAETVTRTVNLQLTVAR